VRDYREREREWKMDQLNDNISDSKQVKGKRNERDFERNR